ncbi:MAG: exonuclease domain-containing protein [Saprospiraceae bacterium]|nr:exonuclease domain-containing protein [Saprospiraceae bacterium]
MSKEKRYAIIDIETTGGSAARERITEIAVVVHDGSKVIETFESLINPERSIPSYITQITGISDAMVADAPKFYEIAKKIVQLTEGAVFVAHNVRFDYGFVQEEFRRLGYAFSRQQLCTVKLSRVAFPGLRSYALGNLIQHFGIKVADRHRALADTLATVEIFEKILLKEENQTAATQMVNKGIRENALPEGISMQKLDELPETCGVYYLHDKQGDVIYVGKSINIQKRIFEHFKDKTTKGDQFQQAVADITFEETGSELVALLLEDREIKHLKPRVNKAQRKTFFPYCVYAFTDENGFLRFHAVKNVALIRKKHVILQEFEKLNDAKQFLKNVAKRFELCEKLMEPVYTEGACFYHQIGQCKGACVGTEKADSYNERATEARDRMNTQFEFDFFIIDKGKSADEAAVVLVKKGHVRGFGYVNKEGATVEDFYEAVKIVPPSIDANRIVRLFLHQNKQARTVKI